MSSTPTIRAAGGIVRRPAPQGGWELLLVHRPRYDDWSLPKGKADGDESDEETALREVEEETGLRCRLGDTAGETRYRDAKGRPKVVRYWLMEPPTDTKAFTPNQEVDAVRWCSPGDAVKQLTYAHDRELVQRLGEFL